MLIDVGPEGDPNPAPYPTSYGVDFGVPPEPLDVPRPRLPWLASFELFRRSETGFCDLGGLTMPLRDAAIRPDS